MARTSGRVILSKNPKENIELAEKIYAKHVALAAASPLKTIDGINVDAVFSTLASTKALHQKAEDSKRIMEEAYRQRDEQIKPILETLKKSINLLKASYPSNPKKLGEWGINIDDTPQAKPKPKA